MSREYDNYLFEHIEAVRKAAEWMLENLSCANDLDDAERKRLLRNAALHDSSKYSSYEYKAYDDWFYGTKDKDAFDRAWLHHIHENPHHWQHWLLMNDDGKYRDPDKVIPLEMPKVYVFEMVADWWSFSWRSGNLFEMFDWYESHRHKMLLHDSTREYLEGRILAEMRERLEDGMSETDVLRRKLSKYGVEYRADGCDAVKVTYWPYDGGHVAAFAEHADGKTNFSFDYEHFSPTQAICATILAEVLK